MGFSLSSLGSLGALVTSTFIKPYMARLGPFQFSVESAAFSDLQRSASYEWQAKNRVGRKPAQQFTGPGADTITLSGVIYPHYKGGLGQLAAMRAMAGTGEPQPLVYAFEQVGQYCGRWCITAIEETRTVFFQDGRPRKIEFSITLVEYGEDAGVGLVSGAGAQKGGLSGLLGAFGSAVSLATKVLTASGKISGSQAANLSAIGSFAGSMGAALGPTQGSVSSSISVADSLKVAGAAAVSILGDTPDAGRISSALDVLTADSGRHIATTSQSSVAMNAAYNDPAAATYPPELTGAMRGSQRGMGELSKLITDTVFTADRIRGSLS